ncbi:adrenocorticotropic hormone receptor-like [Oculina patagonica]
MGSDTTPFVVNAAINIPFSLLAVVGNSLILAAFVKKPSLISPSNVILISLAISDFCVGLIVQPLYITFRFNPHVFTNGSLEKHIFVSTTAFLSAILCSFSMFTVTALSVDRYLALRLHLRYKEFVTVRRVCCFLGVLCVGSTIICTVTLWFPAYDEFTGSFIAIGCFALNAVLYFKIYRVVQRHRREINTQQHCQISNAGLVNILRFRHSFLAMFYVYLIFLLCYLPYISLALVFPVFKTNISLKIAFEISWALVYINSSLNPLLYSWRLKGIRMAVKNILYGLCRRKAQPHTEGNTDYNVAIPS